jgi:mono/diheme cytochrome c family protein
MKSVKIALVFVLAAVFAIACSQSTSTPNVANTGNAKPTNAAVAPTPSPVDEMAQARNLYTTHCMTCHKDSGKGGKVTVDGKTLNPEDLTSDKMRNKSNEKLIEYVTDGLEEDGMPAFKDKLTEAEIKQVVRHVRFLQGT